jgi:hypothetical protein
LRIFWHFEVAADDGEIGLAFAEQGGACRRAIGLHRAQPDLAALLVVEGLRQRLHHLEVVAVGRADRDPERHRRIAAASQRPARRRERASPASVTNVSRCFADRGEEAAGLSAEGGPSAINPWTISFGVQFHVAGASTSIF